MERRKSYKGGCGCLLTVLGSFIVLCSVIFAFALYVADEDAGEKHDAWVAEYNEQVSALDSIQDVAVRDSLIETIPAPYVRQGGFATLAGIIFGGIGLIVGVIPLIVGLVLIRKHRRERQKEYLEP